jgi:DNA polymerase III alpha subunit
MKRDSYGQIIYSDQDLVDLVMQGRQLEALRDVLVDKTVDLELAAELLTAMPNLLKYDAPVLPVVKWDQQQQQNWHMPDEYKQLDIAEYVIGLCTSQEELQRVGTELLMFQQRDLFDLLRYLKYLVDIMRENQLIWGVGRGSSTASYVLYLLGVHRIDSMYYDLDPEEFLR